MWSSFWSSSSSSTTATGSGLASTADSLGGKKAIGESSSSFPYEIVEPILIGKDEDYHHRDGGDEDEQGRNKTIIKWDLYSGRDKRKAVKGATSNSSSSVSIFKFELVTGDFSSSSSPYDNPQERAEKAAVNAIKRLRSLRHPNILSFIDSSVDNKGDGKKAIGQSSSSPLFSVVIVTESVLPVLLYLERVVGGGESSKNDDEDDGDDEKTSTTTTVNNVIAWGVVQVSKAVAFLNRDVKLSHNNLSASCVYVSCPGNRSWKVGGFEASSPIDGAGENGDDDDGRRGRRVGGIRKARQDSIGLARIIWQLYNRHSQSTRVGANRSSPAQIPKSLHLIWIKLSKGDISPEDFVNEISSTTRSSGSLTNNPFIQVVDFFDQIQIKDERERSVFFSQLNSGEGDSSSHLLSSVPRDICAHRILPSLLTALEFSASSTPANNSSSPALLLATFFKVVAKSRLSESEIKSQVVPIVVKLFVARQDRATRAILLQQCESFLPHVEESVVNSTLYPAVVSGFLDSNPTIRELTVKSMIHFAPRLSRANLSEDLMKHFSRLQAQEEEGVIRTNTIVCLGKIGAFLSPPSLRQTLLVTACLRAMRDPFPPARVNGILALSACQSLISLKETATRVMPALCHLTMDTEKSVRDVAFKSLKGFLSKLEKVSEDPSLVALLEADVNSTTNDSSSSSNSSNLVRSLGGKAFGSLLTSTSWLTSSLSSSVNSLLPFSGSSSSSSGPNSTPANLPPPPSLSNQLSFEKETTSSSSSRASTVTGKTGERERGQHLPESTSSSSSSNKQQQPRRGGGLIDLDDWATVEVDEGKKVGGVAVESGLKSRLELIEEKGKAKETKSVTDDNGWNNQEDDDWSKFDDEEANDNEMKKKKDEDKKRTTEVVDRRTARTTTTTTTASKKKSSAPLKLGATRLSSQKKTDDLDF